MKPGTENRRKTVIAGSLGTIALICCGYLLYDNFGGSSSPATPPPSIAPINSRNEALNGANTTATTPNSGGNTPAARPNPVLPSGNAAGVNAKKVASTSANLDPTLDAAAMLRTESLVYTGAGRNIFSAVYAPVAIPTAVAPVRKVKVIPCPPNCPPPPPPPPPPPTCPPSCPPIPLKFFGTATKANGIRQAFLLQGDDVFLAGQGDIIARKYKIVAINPSSIQIEDLTNTNTQTLPLQQ